MKTTSPSPETTASPAKAPDRDPTLQPFVFQAGIGGLSLQNGVFGRSTERFADILIYAIILWLAAEVFEHIVFPLIRKAGGRRPPALTGPEAMIGRTGVVRRWEGDRGQVSVGNEIWAAECDTPLSPGDRVVVEDIRGLTLRVCGER